MRKLTVQVIYFWTIVKLIAKPCVFFIDGESDTKKMPPLVKYTQRPS